MSEIYDARSVNLFCDCKQVLSLIFIQRCGAGLVKTPKTTRNANSMENFGAA